MRFFIDTANLSRSRGSGTWNLDGVTTNPSLMARRVSKASAINEHYKRFCDIVDGDVSAEVFGTEYDDMIRQGEELAALHPQITIKPPVQRWHSCREVFL